MSPYPGDWLWRSNWDWDGIRPDGIPTKTVRIRMRKTTTTTMTLWTRNQKRRIRRKHTVTITMIAKPTQRPRRHVIPTEVEVLWRTTRHHTNTTGPMYRVDLRPCLSHTDCIATNRRKTRIPFSQMIEDPMYLLLLLKNNSNTNKIDNDDPLYPLSRRGPHNPPNSTTMLQTTTRTKIPMQHHASSNLPRRRPFCTMRIDKYLGWSNSRPRDRVATTN